MEAYNSKLNAYQSRYGEAREFDQGEYNGSQINIYQFRDLPELRLVLAHELGHALGMNHTENSASIMYYLMQDQDMDAPALSPEDQAVFSRICGVKDESPIQLFSRFFLVFWPATS